MSDDDLKELDAIFGGGEVGVDLAGDAPASEPAGTSTATEPRAHAGASPVSRRGSLGWIFFAFVVTLWSVTSFRGCDFAPIPDGDHVSVDSIHVLMVPADVKDMTEEQGQAYNSAKVSAWCESHKAEFRRYQVEDDLSKAEPIWQQLRMLATNPPEIVIATPKRTVVKRVESLDQVLEDLDGEAK